VRPIQDVMSMNVQAYGAPARVTLRDYEQAGSAVTPPAPAQPPAAKSADRFTASDRTAAAANSYADAMRVAALRRDAAAPGVGATDRAKTASDDTVIASARQA
jgi:hypothetical protein